MYILRELMGTLQYELDYDPAYDTLLDRLQGLSVPIVKEDRARRQIVVRCLCDLKNYILWRCWGDKLLFRLRPIAPQMTHVDVFAIPNLWRIKVRSREQVRDPITIIRQLVQTDHPHTVVT